MTRRLVALLLWTYLAWYAGSTLALFTGAPSELGPLAGLGTALVGAIGWFRIIRRRTANTQSLSPEPAR